MSLSRKASSRMRSSKTSTNALLPFLTPILILLVCGVYTLGRRGQPLFGVPGKQMKDGRVKLTEAQQLTMAAGNGNIKRVKDLLDRNVSANARWEPEGNTALMGAVSGNHPDVVEMLLQAKADVNAHRKDGGTALIAAASLDEPDTVSRLIRAGANPAARDSAGWSPLGKAVFAERPRTIALLLDAGVQPNLSEAILLGDLQAVKTHLAQGARADEHGPQDITPLMWAAETGNVQVLSLLISHHGDVNSKCSEPAMLPGYGGSTPLVHIGVESSGGSGTAGGAMPAPDTPFHPVLSIPKFSLALEGTTPLMLAAGSGNPDAVQFLLSRGAKANARNRLGATAISFANRKNTARIVRLLAAAGTPLESASPRRATPLITAVNLGDLEKVNALLDCGANVNAVNGYDETALMLAARNNSLGIVKRLLQAGADLHLRSRNNWDALTYARSSGSYDTVQLLRRALGQPLTARKDVPK